MISGSFDPFTEGAYSLVLNYKGIVKTANVTVLDRSITGTYKSAQFTIGYNDEYEDDEGYTVGDSETSQAIKDLVIPADLNVTVREKPVLMKTTSE